MQFDIFDVQLLNFQYLLYSASHSFQLEAYKSMKHWNGNLKFECTLILLTSYIHVLRPSLPQFRFLEMVYSKACRF